MLWSDKKKKKNRCIGGEINEKINRNEIRKTIVGVTEREVDTTKYKVLHVVQCVYTLCFFFLFFVCVRSTFFRERIPRVKFEQAIIWAFYKIRNVYVFGRNSDF